MQGLFSYPEVPMPTDADPDEPRTCERCNELIPVARVKALPATWLCLT